MTSARSLLQFWRNARVRRLLYGLAALLFVILSVFPQPHVVRAKILPQDPSSAGAGALLGSLGGQIPSLGALLGGRSAVDFYLVASRSENVRSTVIERLNLVGSGAYASERKAKIALGKKVDIHSLTGGVIEIETKSFDGGEARALTDAYVKAISERLKGLGRQQIINKQKIVDDRFGEAARRVGETEAALNNFRRRNRILADPEAQLGSAISIRTGLEGRLQAKLVELSTVQQFAGPENPQLIALQSEIGALRTQIARTTTPTGDASGPNAAGLTQISSEYLNLYRDYRFSQALFEVYSRLSEQIAVEEMSSGAADVQLVERANEDAERHYNLAAVALLILTLLLAFFTEFYAPATGLKLPWMLPPTRARDDG